MGFDIFILSERHEKENWLVYLGDLFIDYPEQGTKLYNMVETHGEYSVVNYDKYENIAKYVKFSDFGDYEEYFLYKSDHMNDDDLETFKNIFSDLIIISVEFGKSTGFEDYASYLINPIEAGCRVLVDNDYWTIVDIETIRDRIRQNQEWMRVEYPGLFKRIEREWVEEEI